MKTIDKYLTESKVSLKRDKIKSLMSKPKSGNYTIDGNQVRLDTTRDIIIWKYPSDFHMLTYMLIDLSDEMGYNYQQLGMNTKDQMKFVVDIGE